MEWWVQMQPLWQLVWVLRCAFWINPLHVYVIWMSSGAAGLYVNMRPKSVSIHWRFSQIWLLVAYSMPVPVRLGY